MGQQAFKTFGLIPPGIGIVHQVNLEYLAKGVLRVVSQLWRLDLISPLLRCSDVPCPIVSELFKWRQFEPEVILLAVGRYLRFSGAWTRRTSG